MTDLEAQMREAVARAIKKVDRGIFNSGAVANVAIAAARPYIEADVIHRIFEGAIRGSADRALEDALRAELAKRGEGK